MLYNMGHLAQLVDVRAFRVEVVVPGLIEHAIGSSLALIQAELREQADVSGLRRDVDELKSTDLSMFFGTVDFSEVPSLEIPTISEIPLATAIRDDTTVYDELEDLERAMVQMATEASLQYTSMIGSNGAHRTPGGESDTDALIETTPGAH
ncbi:hypothetical protein KY284_020314 [Solanum tuberosum]|nr:hypothetical protein KY284_020314 [Solanum tuberosum]